MLLTTLLSTLAFSLALLGLFFLPGFLLTRFSFRLTELSFFEEILIAWGLGFGFLNTLMLILGRWHIPFTRLSLSLGLASVSLLLFVLSLFWRRFSKGEKENTLQKNEREILRFSKRGSLLFLLLFASTLFVKTIYLNDAILPSATDLGHHMYWSKVIAITGALPNYTRIDIVTDVEGNSKLSPPLPIADFIVGEHLPFAALALFTHLDFLGAFPINFLHFLNLLSILACALLAWQGIKLAFPDNHSLAEKIFLLTFLFLGPLYTLASPQAKYVSGGVVGNIFGNFFIPLILFCFLRAFTEKKSSFLSLGLFLSFTLAYIHHLSTLILVFALLGTVFSFFLFHPTQIFESLLSWGRIFRKPIVLSLLGGILLFLFFVALPSYFNPQTINTALGTPTRATRTGLTFLQTTGTVGMAKIALALSGLVLILFSPFRKSYTGALFFGWSASLLLMTLEPSWLFLDIPSDRIGSYLVFPLALTAALAVGMLFTPLGDTEETFFSRLPFFSGSLLFLVLFTFVLGNGSYENNGTLLSKSKATEITQTLAASQYLAEHRGEEDIILKDHNYIAGDAWMKLFFMRDYGYPLSRGLFTRYETGGRRREQCTLQMISIPNTPEGKKCFTDTGTNLVVINPQYDRAQFEKSSDFARLYTSEAVEIYNRH